jgi:cellulose synthase/poly-beta-1,6-N-acetylglucosamine synthase-like glycosyltransferase
MDYGRLILDVVYFISLYYAVFWLVTFFSEKQLKVLRENFSYPKISIIIPMYNEEQNIVDTIENICDVDYDKKKLRLIVVDDGSQDKSYELANATLMQVKKKYPEIDTLLLRQDNSGKYRAMNYALEYVDTEFFATLDADSYPSKDSLKIV